MPPRTSRIARSDAGRLRRRAGALLAACGLVLLPRTAQAVVGGLEEAGPLRAASVMVLSSRGGVCTGIVLAPDAVLTAAHCASGASDFRVHYRGSDGQPVLIDPAQRVLNPGYDRGAVAGRRRSIDLALLKLPAPLPDRFTAASLSATAPTDGASLRIGGYGVAREGDGRSTGTFRIAALTAYEPYGRSTILVWAKGADATRSGACEGDSGGPIASETGTVAVTTWASGKGRRTCGDVTQGVLLGPQRAWIDRVLATWGRQAAWR